MMRWLKDKKKEKRSSTSSQIDDEKEDDYGFGKEKAASKSSSSSRRELPPTPATPEERSPHIYEEIPDLSYRSMSDNEKTLLQSKFGKIKNGLIATAGTIPESPSLAIKSFSSDKDEISPYLIVPVDNEVRQTPTDFHRNGTPEVHCDVIVKDTHCEILLTRKPKVGAFRLDNPALSAAGDSDDKKSIRNNTHFCSRDRRANSYVQSAGNLSSAFSTTLSSSPATKIRSSTLGNLTESLEPCQENDLDKAEDGVVTYSTASNFIPRATKLVFHPLPGNNPRKEAFGSDSSDELRGVGYSSIKEDDFGIGGSSFASGRELQPGSKCVTYATVEFHGSLEPVAESQVTYASVQDQHFTNSQTKPNYSFDDHNNAQSNNKTQQKIHPDGDTNCSRVATRTGIIRPLSPSNSSNCIYALVTFPTEPTHYNTISDISPSDFPENVPEHEERFRGLVYSSVNERFGAKTVCLPCDGEKCDTSNHDAPFSGNTSFHMSDKQRELSQTSCFNFSERIHSVVNLDRVRFDSQNYRGVVDHTDFKEGQLTANGAQSSTCAKISSEPHTSSGPGQSNILLEFCFCSDERSSSCDCADAKHSQDDDLASVAGAASEGSNSCRSCGRLIRQITYSESYSDETYDHVYSSRLLIKTGRRFSSPDITFSEVSNSEFPDVQNTRSLDFPYAASRDDSWASPRNSDIFPPSYRASAESKLFYKIDNPQQFKDHTSVDDLRCNYNNGRESSEISQYTFVSTKRVEQYSCETSEHVPTHHTLNLPANKRSATASDNKQPKCKVGKNESWVLKTEKTSVLNNPGQSTPSSSADHSKSIRESTFDKSVVEKSGSDNFGYEKSAVGKSAVESSVVDGSFADKSKKLDKSVSDKSRKLDKPASDKSKKLDKPIPEKSKKFESALTLEPKSGGFTGLFMKFSRTKSSKHSKPEEAENFNCYCAPEEQVSQDQPVRCDRDLEEIPDKNTRKLSHFFQRLASKELTTKDTTDCAATSQETDELASTLTINNVKLTEKSLKLLPLESNTKSTNYKYCRDDNKNTLLQTVKVPEEAQICWSSAEIQEINVASQLHIFPIKKQICTTRTPVIAAISDHLLPEAASRSLDKDVTVNSEGLLSNSNPQFKTDSGDTCYEYDISTSSEGEQPGYEYFLSKVKKSLNLDREVQHISEPNFVRKKCLCKRCKNEGLYATIDDDENDIAGKDGLCPHLAAKFGDMRAMFEDLVVDQRAAILDCLSDYTLNPYGSRGHSQDGGYCRDCGCEILTSDSESLTTVSSLLSQQFRMTSPNGQAMSCDSDEGTMADNSCESADENGESKNNKCHYDGHSSGYDEPKCKSENAGQKSRRKERKEKKLASSTATHFATNEPEKLSLSLANTIHNDSPAEALLVQTSKDENKTIISSVSAESHRKSILKKNTSSQLSAHSSRHAAGLSASAVSESKDDHSKICDISRSRTSTLTDKVLQDIYSPLPSKALSRLTSRSFSSPVGLSCTCGRGAQASLATVTAHLATGKTITPPSGCTRKDNSLKPSPTSLPHCDGDEKVRVVPVQKHSEKGGKTDNEGEQFILNERKDNLKNDPLTMDVHCEKDVLENNDCVPTLNIVESNECLPPQTKPGNRTFRKQRSPVPAKEGSPLRNRTPITKQFSEPASTSGCGVFASPQHEKQCAQMSLPHTTQNAAASAFNPEITVTVSSEHVCSEIHFSDAFERSFVELKSEDTKTESTRKHRLKIVALDLLPESVVDGDNIASAHPLKKHVIQPKRSNVIAKMAKLFESNSDFTNNNQTITEAMLLDSTTKKDSGHKARLHKEYTIEKTESQNIVSQPRTENHFISEFSENISNRLGTRPKRSVPATALLNPTDNLCGRRESHNLNLNASPPASDLLATSKTLRSRSRSKQGKGNETKAAKSDNEGGRLKSVKVKSGKTKSPHLKESRFPKQRSPTPSSSSSISSSSSSKRKSGHAKTKTSKQTYSRKRSKHRSERNKNGRGKEERTYYYFSSDFSDIDVVEVENSEPYNTVASKEASTNNKLAISIKKRCASSENLLASPDHSTELPANNTNESAADGGSCEQEVYAIPGSSSDLRGRKNSNEAGESPQPSPEMTKYRKLKRTDVYKSKKSNNKLLSDLIIRNYDMQVYGNI